MGRRFDCNSIDKACRQTSSKWGSLLSKMPSNSDGRRKCTRLSRHRGLAIHLQFRALGSFAGCCPRVHTPHGCIPAPPHVGSFSTRRIQVVRDLAGATAMLSFLSLSLSLSLSIALRAPCRGARLHAGKRADAGATDGPNVTCAHRTIFLRRLCLRWAPRATQRTRSLLFVAEWCVTRRHSPLRFGSSWRRPRFERPRTTAATWTMQHGRYPYVDRTEKGCLPQLGAEADEAILFGILFGLREKNGNS